MWVFTRSRSCPTAGPSDPDGKLSAHYENTIAITDGEPEILTSIDGEVL